MTGEAIINSGATCVTAHLTRVIVLQSHKQNNLSALTYPLEIQIDGEDMRFNILLAQREVAPGGQVLEVRVLGCWHCPNMG